MTMKARWLAGLAIAGALAVAGMPRGSAQQAPAATITPGATIGFRNFGGTFFPNMGMAPGFRNFGGGTFFPNLAAPLGFRNFGRPPFLGGVQAPLNAGLTPVTANPFSPDIRQPQSGLFNPVAGVPLGAVPAGVAGGASFSAFGPNSIGTTGIFPNSQVPIVAGDPRASLSAGFNPSVTVPSLSSAFNPAVASPFFPNAALPQSSAFNPSVVAPGVVAEQRALAAAQRVMANTALTEGVLTSLDASGARIRLANNGRATVTRFPLAQVFFFGPGGRLLTATAGSGRIPVGTRVLVPVSTAGLRR
jgi:hypothetical protein